MTDDDRLLTTEELAAFLDVPIKTLHMWRYRDEGPVGFRVGRHVRCRWSDVEQWIGTRVRAAEVRRKADRKRARAQASARR